MGRANELEKFHTMHTMDAKFHHEEGYLGALLTQASGRMWKAYRSMSKIGLVQDASDRCIYAPTSYCTTRTRAFSLLWGSSRKAEHRIHRPILAISTYCDIDARTF